MDESSMLEIAVDDATTVNEPQRGDSPYGKLQDNQIRLLQILEGPANTEISCQIISISLQDEPVYTALSYVWGRGPAECAINLNGQRIYVRKNLWRLLQQVRKLDCSMFGRIWIDALCIDQSDTDERTRQVSIMPKIYSAAKQVLVWLGPAYADSDMAMRHLTKPISYWHAKKHLLKISHRNGIAIRRLCIRPYWTRLWVLQELLLAKEVRIMCGARVNDWVPFRDVLLQIDDRELSEGVDSGGRFQFETIQASPAIYMARQSTQSLQQNTLWNLLIETQGLGCPEVKDRVYALLGVADSGSTGLIADYGMPLSTLMNLILKYHYERAPPKSLKDVKGDCDKLEEMLSADAGSIFSLLDQQGRFPRPNDATMAELPFNSVECFPINLWWASFYGHSPVKRLLFSEDVLDKRTILMSAVDKGNIEAVQLLFGIDEVELNSRGVRGRTALHQAVLNQDEPMVKFLLDADRIDVNSMDDTMNTPLHKAVMCPDRNIVQLLLNARNISLSARNVQEMTAIYLATVHGDRAIADMIFDTCKTNGKVVREDETVGEYNLDSIILQQFN